MAIRRTHFITGKKDVAPTVNHMLSGFRKYFEGVLDEMMDAAEEAGHEILENAIDFAPADTFALRESGKVYIDKRNKKDPRVEVAFGGTTPVIDKHSPDGVVDYAIEVHENMEGQYRVGGPKYLLNGANAAMPRVREILMRGAKRGHKAGGRKVRG